MKWALIHLGSDVVYGMTFFAKELQDNNEEFHWFDGDSEDILPKLEEYMPDYVCFGPLSSEFETAVNLAKMVKRFKFSTRTVFGGHHVKVLPDEINSEHIDYLVLGTCYDIIDKIISSSPNTVINGSYRAPSVMDPELDIYYTQVPRIGRRPRKYIMSHWGCTYNCSYCGTSATRKAVGSKIYKECYLTRRPVDNVLAEARILQKFHTEEIGLNDDDVLHDTRGGSGTAWLQDFAKRWNNEIGVPLYANVTPNTVVKADDAAIAAVASIAKTVQMGLQTIDANVNKIFNRSFQSEEQVIQACERLISHGLKVKLELIIGVPNIDGLVPEPVESAIRTINFCNKLAKLFPGKIKAQCNALVVFPGTDMWTKCIEQKINMRDAWKKALYEGVGSIIFTEEEENRLKNLIKLATMIVKFNLDDEWIRALIDMRMTDSARLKFSQNQYLDSLTFRLGDDANELDFQTILKDMTFKY